MATQAQKSDIVTHIREANTQLLDIVDRIEVLKTSFDALGLPSNGAGPLADGDLQSENGGLTAQQIFDAIYALGLAVDYVKLSRAALEGIRTGW